MIYIKIRSRSEEDIMEKKYSVEEIRERGNAYSRAIRIRLLEFLGMRCLWCGYDKDIHALQLDHINGGGTREEKLFGNNRMMCSYYLHNPEFAKQKLQVLCANCNQIKRYKHREHTSKYINLKEGMVLG